MGQNEARNAMRVLGHKGRDNRRTGRCGMQQNGAEQQKAYSVMIALDVEFRAQALADAPAGAAACLMAASSIGSTASFMASRRCSAVSL